MCLHYTFLDRSYNCEKMSEEIKNTKVPERNEEAYKFYDDVLGSPKYILAPMVDQSELAFRAMSRELGVQLCYTPMWHAGIFSKDEKYRAAAIEKCPKDRPLLFQVSSFGCGQHIFPLLVSVLKMTFFEVYHHHSFNVPFPVVVVAQVNV